MISLTVFTKPLVVANYKDFYIKSSRAGRITIYALYDVTHDVTHYDVTCYDVTCYDVIDDCKISSLHIVDMNLFVGLLNGKLLMIDLQSMSPLAVFHCHEDRVKPIFSLKVRTMHALSIYLYS